MFPPQNFPKFLQGCRFYNYLSNTIKKIGGLRVNFRDMASTQENTLKNGSKMVQKWFKNHKVNFEHFPPQTDFQARDMVHSLVESPTGTSRIYLLIRRAPQHAVEQSLFGTCRYRINAHGFARPRGLTEKQCFQIC